jgi:hypothetical protein
MSSEQEIRSENDPFRHLLPFKHPSNFIVCVFNVINVRSKLNTENLFFLQSSISQFRLSFFRTFPFGKLGKKKQKRDSQALEKEGRRYQWRAVYPF